MVRKAGQGGCMNGWMDGCVGPMKCCCSPRSRRAKVVVRHGTMQLGTTAFRRHTRRTRRGSPSSSSWPTSADCICAPPRAGWEGTRRDSAPVGSARGAHVCSREDDPRDRGHRVPPFRYHPGRRARLVSTGNENSVTPINADMFALIDLDLFFALALSLLAQRRWCARRRRWRVSSLPPVHSTNLPLQQCGGASRSSRPPRQSRRSR